MKKNEIPEYVLRYRGIRTAREFKRDKRREIKAVLDALDELRLGCAWLPNGSDLVGKADDAMKALRVYCKAESWGR